MHTNRSNACATYIYTYSQRDSCTHKYIDAIYNNTIVDRKRKFQEQLQGYNIELDSFFSAVRYARTLSNTWDPRSECFGGCDRLLHIALCRHCVYIHKNISTYSCTWGRRIEKTDIVCTHIVWGQVCVWTTVCINLWLHDTVKDKNNFLCWCAHEN